MSTIESAPEQLIPLAREDNHPARGQLLEGYRPYLTLLARVQIGRKLRGKVDADDIVQEVFLRAHREFTGFRGQTEPELAAWLRRILATSLAMQVRHYMGTKARNTALEQSLADDLDASSWAIARELAAPISSPSQQASKREQAVLLAAALAQLPEDYREAIILRHIEQLPFVEVAQKMERSIDSVKKLWVRGLASLRRLLENEA
jgi:RNA polymerase sigma-70 factor (ECF subfamily)